MLPLLLRTLCAPIDGGMRLVDVHRDVGHAHASRPRHSASTLIAAPPASKLATICAVTSAGKADTPAAVTPWSPANTTTRARWNWWGGHAALARRHPHRQLLEAPQRAGRFGQRVLAGPRLRGDVRVGRGDRREFRHDGSFTVTGWPGDHQHHAVAQLRPAAG